MKRKNEEKIIGKCSICGTYGELNKEHIPPQSAYNKNKFYILSNDEGMNRKYDEPIIGKKPIQGGVWFNSLCIKCNTDTGTSYVTGYKDFVEQGMIFLQSNEIHPNLLHIYSIYPLKVIKQVITMIMSINHKYELWKSEPELSEFILNKEKKT